MLSVCNALHIMQESLGSYTDKLFASISLTCSVKKKESIAQIFMAIFLEISSMLHTFVRYPLKKSTRAQFVHEIATLIIAKYHYFNNCYSITSEANLRPHLYRSR